ncbi:hypothetical protein FKM82_020128 [Ascaphus truei]
MSCCKVDVELQSSWLLSVAGKLLSELRRSSVSYVIVTPWEAVSRDLAQDSDSCGNSESLIWVTNLTKGSTGEMSG